MNPFVLIMGVLVPVSVFFSYTQDWLEKNATAGNWRAEMREAWRADRLQRPCIGAHDPACELPEDAKEKTGRKSLDN